MKYEDARAQIDDLDLILFSGLAKVSQGIRITTRSMWSHVGVAMWDPARTMLLCFETAPETKIEDYFTKSTRHGVQAVSLSSRIAIYDGTVYWRRLEFERSPWQRAQLHQIRKELSGILYEKEPLELVRAASGGAVENRGSIFCSELTAHTLKSCRVLNEPLPSNAYTPEDLSTQVDREIRWYPGVVPHPEVQLEMLLTPKIA